MTPDRAETIGLDALTFLAGLPERIEDFMRLSGLEPEFLRTHALDPDLLGAVLGFLLTDDAMVLDFCLERELEARDIHLAHHMLEKR